MAPAIVEWLNDGWYCPQVLLCDPEAKKLLLTLKKTLVESKLPAITCYADAKPEQQTHGFILRVKDYGCIVKFYNDVQGLVPRHELSAEYIQDPERLFYPGQVTLFLSEQVHPIVSTRI